MQKIFLTALILSLCSISNSQNKNFIDQPYIEVSGSADTLVTPNEIYIRIVISEKDTRDRISIEEQELKMVNALKNLGFDTEKDLTTSDITSNFRYYFLKGKDVLKSKLYILKVTTAISASKVFISLEDLGISNMAIERVGHSGLRNLENLMRTGAIIDARNKAVAMTTPLNQSINSAIHIEEFSNVPSQLQGRVAGISIRGTNTIRGQEPELPQIEFEKIKVTASVNVKFLLK